jgi:hypothetical protein
MVDVWWSHAQVCRVYAESAYLEALALAPGSVTAAEGLARARRGLGEDDEEEEERQRQQGAAAAAAAEASDAAAFRV